MAVKSKQWRIGCKGYNEGTDELGKGQRVVGKVKIDKDAQHVKQNLAQLRLVQVPSPGSFACRKVRR